MKIAQIVCVFPPYRGGIGNSVYNISKVLRKSFDTDWIEEVVAGIGVQHTHIHLLPRKRDDGLGEIPTKPLNPKLSVKEMEDICNKIKSLLKY